MISYFAKNGIRIKQICAGSQHCLALSEGNNVYQWGCCWTECDQQSSLHKPTLVEYLKDFVIVEIKACGSRSYARSECGQHFLWGDNSDQQCTLRRDENYI